MQVCYKMRSSSSSRAIADYINLLSTRQNHEFNKLLSCAIGSLVKAHADNDANIRLLAEENLNRIVAVCVNDGDDRDEQTLDLPEYLERFCAELYVGMQVLLVYISFHIRWIIIHAL